jgi:DNA-binding transcriptional ArsR family regulator
MAALASAARQEILDALAQLGSVSIADLAAAVGRPADGLYYHLRILQRAGLVEPSGFRETERGREALVQAAGRDLRIDYDTSRRRNTDELAAVISSMMRLGIRDFRNAIGNEEIVVSGNHRELWASRKTGWLSKEELPRVIRSIEDLGRTVARPSGKGQLYAITVLFTPLNRPRTANGSSRKRAANSRAK